MKTLLLSLLLIGTALNSDAQSTLEFTAYLSGLNVAPPDTSHPYDGTGTFFLSGNTFSYDIRTDFLPEFRGKLYGPAPPGINGSPLFDLNPPYSIPPLPPFREGYSSFTGSVLLSDEQIPDLTAGLWYVQLNHRTFSYALRGQIVPVPEPSAGVLIGMAMGVLLIGKSSIVGRKP